MATAMKVATFPFRVTWRLLTLLVLPLSLAALSGWLVSLGALVFWVPLVFALVWAIVMTALWWLQTTGELRSLARGTVHVRSSRRRRRR